MSKRTKTIITVVFGVLALVGIITVVAWGVRKHTAMRMAGKHDPDKASAKNRLKGGNLANATNADAKAWKAAEPLPSRTIIPKEAAVYGAGASASPVAGGQFMAF